MLLAEVGGKRIRPLPNPSLRGLCPFGHEMRPRCGSINRWHWAHLPGVACDPWIRGETEWHLEWKSNFHPDRVERIITNDQETHIADVYTSDYVVIEFQHSSISAEEIEDRNRFYGPDLIWILDFRDIYRDDRLDFYSQPYGHSFRWKNPKKSLWAAHHGSRGVVWDVGRGRLFVVKKIYPKIPCGGYGFFMDKSEFLKAYSC
jgi:competence protein CoiA